MPPTTNVTITTTTSPTKKATSSLPVPDYQSPVQSVEESVTATGACTEPSTARSSCRYNTKPIMVLDDDGGQGSYTWITINNASPDDPQSKLTLNHEHKEGILRSNYWLHDIEIQAGQIMLKKEFPLVDGLHPPFIKGELVIPALSEFIQIINVGRHWVCMSTIGCEDSTIRVFDSLNSTPNATLIDHGCRMLLAAQDTVTFENEKVQKQVGSSDCGLFSLAFATDLCFGLEPKNQKYNQKEMRQHFVCCLESGKMTPFPKTERRVPLPLSSSKTSVPIFCLCRLPNDKQEYVECFKCKGWYHPECASIPTWAVNSKLRWKCPKCKPRKERKQLKNN